MTRLKYHAFGMGMFGRSSGNEYAFGNNGQRAENELFEGAFSAEFWMYDSRLGRRWEIDPISYEWQSPYATFNNNPIFFCDPFGLEGEGDGTKKAPGSDKKRTRTSSEEYDKRKNKGNKEDSGKDKDIYWHSVEENGTTFVVWNKEGTEITGAYQFPTADQNVATSETEINGDNKDKKTGTSGLTKNKINSKTEVIDKKNTDVVISHRKKSDKDNISHDKKGSDDHLKKKDNEIKKEEGAPPCNPIKGSLNFEWKAWTANPLNEVLADQQIRNVVSQLQKCNKTLFFTVTTPAKIDAQIGGSWIDTRPVLRIVDVMEQRRAYIYNRIMNIIKTLPGDVNPSVKSQNLFDQSGTQNVQINAK
jgi:hypothetical protein